MLHAFGGFFKVVMSDLFPEKPKVARPFVTKTTEFFHRGQ